MTTLPSSRESSWEKGSSPRSPQVAVIRREFVDLTGDHFSAVILNQLLYWTQRVKDFDLLLEEERSFNPECNVLPRHGWIYKTASELIEETMLGISHPTMRKYIKLLVHQGWIDERAHPGDKWNKTTQYRVNLRKLQDDLVKQGSTLPDAYLNAFDSLGQQETSSGLSLMEPLYNEETLNANSLYSEVRNLQSDVNRFHSNVKNLHSYTYTENTTENKSKEHTQDGRAREFFDEILDIWKRNIGQEALQLTSTRTRKLNSILSLYFQSDIQQWERFCERIKASPFLMGGGERRWHVTLDWILDEANLRKVLEGNFDDELKGLSNSVTEESGKTQASKDQQLSSLLASIADPQWREWCSQLDFSSGSRDSVSLGELEGISKAKFLEVEDDKLVWIGSSDKKVLDRIETLRFKLFSAIEKTFPNTRTLRTRLCKEPDPKPSTHYPNLQQNQGEITHA